jgi:hypothetical protein
MNVLIPQSGRNSPHCGVCRTQNAKDPLIIRAEKLGITWANAPQYWVHNIRVPDWPVPVSELLDVCW